MNKASETAVGEIADRDRQLASLLRTARIQDQLDQRLRPLLPDQVRDHVQLACIEADCLVLAADSPAWATRARLEAPKLLEAARKLWPQELTRTRVIVTTLNR